MGYFILCSRSNNGNQSRGLPLPFNSSSIKKKKKGFFSFIFGCAGSLLWDMGFSNGGTQALEHAGSAVVVGRLPQLQHESLGARRYLGSQFPDQDQNPCSGRWTLNHWTARRVPNSFFSASYLMNSDSKARNYILFIFGERKQLFQLQSLIPFKNYPLHETL